MEMEELLLRAQKNGAIHKFLHWLLVDEEHGVIQYASGDAKKTVQDVADLYLREMSGKEISSQEWRDADSCDPKESDPDISLPDTSCWNLSAWNLASCCPQTSRT